jgi:hypothetical protein
VARNGFPDNPGDYPQDDYPASDPTQYANYGGTGGAAYSEYGPPTGYPGTAGRYPDPVPPPTPWFQRPAALIGLGVLSAAVLALLVYAVVTFTNAGTSQSPAVTSGSITTSSAPTSEAVPPPSTATQTAAPESSTAAPSPPTTVTTTVTPTTTAEPTTTQTPTPSTTTTISTSVTTVTETTTKPVLPTIPWPTQPSPTLFDPAPEG